MGAFDFFKQRRRRESAIQDRSMSVEPSREPPPAKDATLPGDGPVTQGGSGGLNLAHLGQIGALIAQAAREGTIQVHQGEPQTLDLRGSGLREEILEIMRRHGIEADLMSPQILEAADVPGLQQEILEALGREDVDFGDGSAGADVRIKRPGDNGPA